MGTDCQNQPEAHLLLQAFRALTRLAAPGLVLKAEAIVSPEMLAPYLGGHDRFRPECDLAYDNQLMVMLWSTLATDAGIIARAGLCEPVHVHSSAGQPDIRGGRIELPPWGFAWLSGT